MAVDLNSLDTDVLLGMAKDLAQKHFGDNTVKSVTLKNREQLIIFIRSCQDSK